MKTFQSYSMAYKINIFKNIFPKNENINVYMNLQVTE